MSKYYEDSIVERMYLKELTNRLRNTFDIKLYQTPPEGKDKYDGILYFFDKGGYKLKKRVIIEVKVRKDWYPTLMLEKIKLNNLLNIRKNLDKQSEKETGDKIESDIWYMSVTPKETYIWKLENKYEWNQEYHNISTNNPSLGKTLKDVTYLDINKSKRFEWTSDTFKYNDASKTQIETINLNIRRNVCIFKSIGL